MRDVRHPAWRRAPGAGVLLQLVCLHACLSAAVSGGNTDWIIAQRGSRKIAYCATPKIGSTNLNVYLRWAALPVPMLCAIVFNTARINNIH